MLQSAILSLVIIILKLEDTELSEEGQAPRQKFFLLFGKFFVEQTFAYTLNIWIYRA